MSCEEVVAAKALLAFSPSCQFQLDTLERTARAIRTEMSASIHDMGITSLISVDHARGLFWMWVLGSYELVRTLRQHKICFDAAAQDRFKAIHDRLVRIRIPFAKLEFARSDKPIGQEMIVGIEADHVLKDYTYEIAGERFSVRALLSEFEKCMGSLRASEVVAARPGDEMALVIRYLITHGPPNA